VRDAEKAAPRIEEFLRDRGIKAGRIEKIPPTLEDVFVSLTTGQQAAEARRV